MTKTPPASDPKRPRDTTPRAGRDGAQAWIAGALKLIARDGPEALRIERLAREIRVSKGSFYWFFENRDDLMEATLDHWRVDYNDVVFAEVEAAFPGRPLADRLAHLIRHVRASDMGRYDAAIRAWALRDARARACVDRVDRDRLEFLTRLFGDPEPSLRAHLFYRAFIAEAQVRTVPDTLRAGDFLPQVADFIAALPPAPTKDNI